MSWQLEFCPLFKIQVFVEYSIRMLGWLSTRSVNQKMAHHYSVTVEDSKHSRFSFRMKSHWNWKLYCFAPLLSLTPWLLLFWRRLSIMSSGAPIPTGLSSTITLNDGVVMPMFGLGTYMLSSGGAEVITSFAIQNGYRLIDTATFYGCDLCSCSCKTVTVCSNVGL